MNLTALTVSELLQHAEIYAQTEQSRMMGLAWIGATGSQPKHHTAIILGGRCGRGVTPHTATPCRGSKRPL